MKSPPKQRKSEPASDIEALWPTEPDTDAHNLKVSTMLELTQRNLELRERVRELEAENERLRALLRKTNNILGGEW